MAARELVTTEEAMSLFGDAAGGYPEPLPAGTYRPPRAGAHVRARAEPEAVARHGIAPLTVIGAAVAVFLLISGITARTTLIQLSENGLALEARLEDLRTEQTRLKIAYESAFNLGAVETYARDQLGMRKPAQDQIQYIDTSAPDRAQLLNPEGNDSFVDKVSDVLSGFGEYFRLTGE